MYKKIIQDQVLLGYISKGGITYGDTENMTPYERKLAFDAIQEFQEQQKKLLSESNKSTTVKDPTTRLTSGM